MQVLHSSSSSSWLADITQFLTSSLLCVWLHEQSRPSTCNIMLLLWWHTQVWTWFSLRYLIMKMYLNLTLHNTDKRKLSYLSHTQTVPLSSLGYGYPQLLYNIKHFGWQHSEETKLLAPYWFLPFLTIAGVHWVDEGGSGADTTHPGWGSGSHALSLVWNNKGWYTQNRAIPHEKM